MTIVLGEVSLQETVASAHASLGTAIAQVYAEAAKSPTIFFNKVVLPTPLHPRIHVTRASGMVMLMSESVLMLP